ncbi:hybrid sensor histidine kinase/response regulator [Chitinophaga sp. CC14]|uniref:ATP-binding response regulator n=1 Tax=Chitinophaga sp. CC14 TaxID=3029199 RepID=UPI003B7619B0
MKVIKQLQQKLQMIPPFYNKMATLGIDQASEIDKPSVIIVNTLAFITGSMVLSIGLFFYSLIHSKMLLYGVLIESAAFYGLLFLNHYGKLDAAKFGMIAIHSFSAVYFGALLGMVLSTELIAAFLITFLVGGACLIFRKKKERALSIAVVACLMVIIEANNYYQVIRPLQLDHVNFYFFRWFSIGGMLALISIGLWLTVRSNIALMESLKNADISRRNFLSSTSHDLRTPLDAIHIAAQELKLILKGSNRVPDMKAIERALKTILPASIYSTEIINDIMDLSKIEAGLPAEIKKIDFHTISWVHNFMEILTPLAAEKNKKLTVKIDRSSIPAIIYTDKLKLTKIVVNLAINAIKYAPQNTEVVIRVEDNKNTLVISVYNDGAIPLVLQSRLFDPFVSGENGSLGGNGLGLHIVDSLVKRLGGSISFFSNEIQGTEFTVKLKDIASDHRNISPVRPGNKTQEKTFAGKKILVIDDQENTITAIRALFRESELYNAQDGLAGLEEAKLVRPDIIFLDSYMPKMNGLQTLQQIMLDDSLRDIPVVLVSADAYKETNEQYIAAGASDFLRKPLEFRELKSVMNRLL